MMEIRGYEAYLADKQPVKMHKMEAGRADGEELLPGQPGSAFWANILVR